MSNYQSDVHAAHCCLGHGCKYGDDSCPVVLGTVKQEYPCEFCDDVHEADFPVVCDNGCPEGYLGRHKFSCSRARVPSKLVGVPEEDVLGWIEAGHGVAVVKYVGGRPDGSPGNISVQVTSDENAMLRPDLGQCMVLAIEPADLAAARAAGKDGQELIVAALFAAMDRTGYC